MDGKIVYKPFKYIGDANYKYSVFILDKDGNIRLMNYGNSSCNEEIIVTIGEVKTKILLE